VTPKPLKLRLRVEPPSWGASELKPPRGKCWVALVDESNGKRVSIGDLCLPLPWVRAHVNQTVTLTMTPEDCPEHE
jgi:hypothetical protein